MCGYIGNAIDDPLINVLMDILGIDLSALRDNPGTGPAASIDIIVSPDRTVIPAIWWLILESVEDKFKPSKYTSFNTRSDKLNTPRSAGYQPYRQSRCIIPATYIIEGEGSKGSRRYHRIEPTNQALALGGLYRVWIHHETGEQVYSCSVITLPPHEQWKSIHSKSTPLMLPTDQPKVIEQWLDPQFQDVAQFESLLTPVLHDALICTPIEKPGKQTVIGDLVRIN